MAFTDALRHRFRSWFRREQLGREMEEEVRFHLELETMNSSRLSADGDAAHAARRRFGNLTSIGESRREHAGLALFDRLSQDARYTARQLRRSPAFAVGVVLTLALGIGANSTMFAVADRVLLRAPAGIRESDRLVQIRFWRDRGNASRDTSEWLSYPSFAEIRGMADVFDHVAAVWGPVDVAIDRGPNASMAKAALLGGDFFGTLGVQPAFGRFFTPDEVDERAGAFVAVISHGYWKRGFGGSTDVIGRPIRLENNTYTIVGVAPAGFSGNTLAATDLWIPIAAAPTLRFGKSDWATLRGALWLTVLGRLAPGVTQQRALAELSVKWTAWNIQPGRVGVRAPRPFFASLVPAESGARPEYRVTRMLFLVALLVLCISCANVANLLLARALSRQREFAIRLALGVSRRRLVALVFLEAIMLSLVGGAAAVALSRWSVSAVRVTLFAGTATDRWAIDGRVATYTALVALLAGLASATVPAIHVGRRSLLEGFKLSMAGGTPRSRVRFLLVVVQGALTITLASGTGLFVRSLQRLGAQHLGLDIDHVITVRVQTSSMALSRADEVALYGDLAAQALRVRDVKSAAISIGLPFYGQYALPLQLNGRDSLPGLPNSAGVPLYAVTPTFFRTIGARIVLGRELLPTDNATAPPVAVVSEEMARRFWPGASPLGQCFKIVLRATTPDCIRVVGVAENSRRKGLVEKQPAVQYYIPLDQAPAPLGSPTLIVRAEGRDDIKQALQRSLQRVHSALPFVQVQSLTDLVASELRPWRLGAKIFGGLGMLALIVAAVGVYSTMQFHVEQRRRELGVRIALGAPAGHIVSMVSRWVLVVALAASVTGTALVIAGGRLVEELLFETSPREPSVLCTAIAVTLVSALFAACGPALTALRIDPARTLRSD